MKFQLFSLLDLDSCVKKEKDSSASESKPKKNWKQSKNHKKIFPSAFSCFFMIFKEQKRGKIARREQKNFICFHHVWNLTRFWRCNKNIFINIFECCITYIIKCIMERKNIIGEILKKTKIIFLKYGLIFFYMFFFQKWGLEPAKQN